MLSPHLKSTVGRRLFLRFLIAALLPMGGLALYAYVRVGDMLVEVNDRRLRQDSKALGMSLMQALNWRAQILKRHAEQVVQGSAPDLAPPEGFTRLDIQPLPPGLDDRQAKHLALGHPVLQLAATGEASLWQGLPASDRLLVAGFDPNELWRNDETPEHYCILGRDLGPLYCTPGLSPPKANRLAGLLAGRNTGSFEWHGSEQVLLGGFWQARTDAAYAHPGFIILVAEPKQALLRDLTQFRTVFLATASLAFGLALLLALSQIRRQMHPLEQLTEGTRRLAAGDFSARVGVTGDDEFGSLAHSFNDMSANLHHKFHLLQMLAELDRAILSASEMDYVFESVLSHIGQAIPCDCAGIMRLDEAAGGSLLSACTAGQRGARSATSRADVSRLLPDDATRPWYRVEWAGTPPACLDRMSDAALTQALVFPVRINQRLDSLLILGYVAPPEPLDEIVAAGCSLTDRLAVAGSNIAWEEKLYHQGHYDALTDLPNRVLLRDRVEQALMRAEQEQSSVAVLLIDLDNFKQINDSLGHSAGDALLIECARRLHAAARQSDTAARLGGDEFILLIPDLVSDQAAAWLDAMASRLNTALATPMVIADRLVTTPASIGIALYPDNARGFEDLLKMADAAMYASKRRQPGAYQFYSGDMNAAVRSRFELTQDLRAAIGNDELVLYYQPKVSASSGRIVGAEALVRWASPQRGLLPPGMFVPLLDEIGLGNWLGDWVMERACAQMAEWDRQGLAPIPVSVNIAPAQFREGRIIERLTAILNDHALPATRLELEILEATAANGSSEIDATLSGLRAMGVRIALDDFGTGYSSLVYLTQLPADILKLDRAFIGNLVSDPRQRAIVQSIISLARALDFEIIAEGVEDRAQMELLAGMGCQLIQGFLISRPVPPEQFAELLRDQDRGGA